MLHDSGVDLQAAIIKQAIYDYKRAVTDGNKYQAKSLEKWFTSEWGQMVCAGNGVYILEKAKAEIRKENKKCAK